MVVVHVYLIQAFMPVEVVQAWQLLAIFFHFKIMNVMGCHIEHRELDDWEMHNHINV